MKMKLEDLDLRSLGNTVQLVGVVYQGGEQTLLFPLPDETVAPSDITLVEMNRDEWAVALRQTDLLEVEVVVKEEDGKLGKAIIRKSQRQIEQHVSWAVFRRDNYTCRYCGNDKTPLTIDHLVLWEDGGPSIKENLVAACKKCNRVRGNTPYAEWLRHPYYQKQSGRLPPMILERNTAVLATLDKIPRTAHQRSR